MSDAPQWLTELAVGSLDVEEVKKSILLTSGRIVACDPLVLLTSADPFTRAVDGGRYHVRVGRVDGDVAYAYLSLGRAKVVRWEVARCPGEEDVEGWPGYGVDSGTGCFVDHEAIQLFREEENALMERVSAKLAEAGVKPTDPDYHERFEKVRAELGANPLAEVDAALEFEDVASVRLSGRSDANLVAFKTGGDGVYASFWGLDRRGRPVALVTDFGVLGGGEEDEDEEDEDEGLDEALDDGLGDLGDLEALAAALGLRPEPEPEPETTQEPSPLFLQARSLLERWIAEEKIELEPDVDVDAFTEHFLEKLVSLSGKRHPGSHLAEWMLERREVADVFASDDELEKDLTPG